MGAEKIKIDESKALEKEISNKNRFEAFNAVVSLFLSIISGVIITSIAFLYIGENKDTLTSVLGWSIALLTTLHYQINKNTDSVWTSTPVFWLVVQVGVGFWLTQYFGIKVQKSFEMRDYGLTVAWLIPTIFGLIILFGSYKNLAKKKI